jgi:magnesium chelatase subunit D
MPGATGVRLRTEVLNHNLLTASAAWDEDLDLLRGVIKAAKDILPHVRISEDDIYRLSVTALQYGVEGHRVDLFAMRAACAAAAFALREEVIDEDLEVAVRLVILPRATQIPTPPPENTPPPPADHTGDEAQSEPQQTEAEPSDQDEQPAAPPEALAPQPEQILEALEAELPESLDELPFQNLRRGRSGSRGSTEGSRGRHVRSMPGDPKRARIDIVATLRAAAPWQPLRADLSANNHRRQKRVYLQPTDLRVKQYRSKAGALFCFAVDASGSMALHRMRQAKGAIHVLLQQAYVNRDRVALIAFRGDQAELLMSPTQSVELAQRALDLLPTGGGTPLASALLRAVDVAESARMRGIMQTVLVMLTDGRANIALRENSDPQEEIQQLGNFIAESSLHVIVVDTKRSYLSRGEARQLAEWLSADYAYLPNASGEAIADLATASAAKH